MFLLNQSSARFRPSVGPPPWVLCVLCAAIVCAMVQLTSRKCTPVQRSDAVQIHAHYRPTWCWTTVRLLGAHAQVGRMSLSSFTVQCAVPSSIIAAQNVTARRLRGCSVLTRRMRMAQYQQHTLNLLHDAFGTDAENSENFWISHLRVSTQLTYSGIRV